MVKPEVAKQGMIPILARAPLLLDESWLFPTTQDMQSESGLACHNRDSISLSSVGCVQLGISWFHPRMGSSGSLGDEGSLMGLADSSNLLSCCCSCRCTLRQWSTRMATSMRDSWSGTGSQNANSSLNLEDKAW